MPAPQRASRHSGRPLQKRETGYLFSDGLLLFSLALRRKRPGGIHNLAHVVEVGGELAAAVGERQRMRDNRVRPPQIGILVTIHVSQLVDEQV